MMDFSRAIKILSTTFFGGEVKPLAACRKILLRVEEPHGVRDISPAEFTAISCQVFFLFRYKVSLLVFAREIWWMDQQ
jgi:hypothetical protein